MTWFTGTSNAGRVYEVGQRYTMGGDVYRAERNGSFTNERTGKNLVGSSQDPRTVWGGGSSLASGGAATSGRTITGGLPGKPEAGYGAGAAASDGRVTPAAGSGSGSRYAVSGRFAAAAAGALGGPGKITQPYFAGMPVPVDFSTSDAELGEQRWGDGDFLSPTWFFQWGVAARDFYTGTFNTEKIEGDLSALPSAAAYGAKDFARYLDNRKAEILAERARKDAESAAERARRDAADPLWNDPLKVYRESGAYPF